MLLNIVLGFCALIYLMFCYVVVYAVAESMKKRDVNGIVLAVDIYRYLTVNY